MIISDDVPWFPPFLAKKHHHHREVTAVWRLHSSPMASYRAAHGVFDTASSAKKRRRAKGCGAYNIIFIMGDGNYKWLQWSIVCYSPYDYNYIIVIVITSFHLRPKWAIGYWWKVMKNDGSKGENSEHVDLSPNSRTKNRMVYPALEARMVGNVEKSRQIIRMNGDIRL